MSESSISQWGQENVHLSFAGQQYFFSGLTTRQKEIIKERFTCLVDDELCSEVTVRTAMEHDEIPQQDPQKFSVNNSYAPICRYRQDGLDVEGYGFFALIDFSDDGEYQLLTGNEQEAAEPFIFENYLRILSAYASLQQGGLFLHSAGILVKNKVYLFIGRSGAGKTTLSYLARKSGHSVLSDDANIVLPAGNGVFQAGPVPFAGELGQVNSAVNHTCPVAGMYWIEQGSDTAIVSVNPALQVARVLACCPVINVDPFRLDLALTNINVLLHSVPLRILRFRRDQPFSVIHELIEEHSYVTS